VLIVDDVLATGGTALAALDLVAQAGGTTVGLSFLIELAALAGRTALTKQPNNSGQWTPTDAQVQSLFVV
jgi:adenine phosphoribosyltransferase